MDGLLENLISGEELYRLFNVQKRWLYRQTRLKAIPFVKIGKYLRFDRRAIEKWLSRQQQG